MKCAIQSVFIAKENILFLEEWLDYHIEIGISNFFLYDNSKVEKLAGFGSKRKHQIPQKVNKWGINYDKLVNLTQSQINNILQKIKEKYKDKVTLIEWSPKDKDGKIIFAQAKAFNDCLQRLKKTDIDWCASIDMDEYIVPSKPLNNYLQDPSILCIKISQFLYESRFNNLNKLVTEIDKAAVEILPRNHSIKYIYNVKNTDSLDIHSVEGKGECIHPSRKEIHFNHYKRDFVNNVTFRGDQLIKTNFKSKIVKNPIDPKIVAILKKKSKKYFIKKIKNPLTRKNKQIRNKTLKSKDQ
jgi:hypothetical protein